MRTKSRRGNPTDPVQGAEFRLKKTPEVLQLIAIGRQNSELSRKLERGKGILKRLDGELQSLTDTVAHEVADSRRQLQDWKSRSVPQLIYRKEREILKSREKLGKEQINLQELQKDINRVRRRLNARREVLKASKSERKQKTKGANMLRHQIAQYEQEIERLEGDIVRDSQQLRSQQREFFNVASTKRENFERKQATEQNEQNRQLHALLEDNGRRSSRIQKGLPKMAIRAAAMYYRSDNTEAELSSVRNRVATTEEAYTKMKSATGISDMRKLTEMIIESDRRNFSAFRHLNELNLEIDELEISIKQTKETMKERESGDGKSDGKSGNGSEASSVKSIDYRKQRVIRLRLAITEANELQTKLEEILADGQLVIESASESVRNLFLELGCAKDPSMESLTLQDIHENNFMNFVGAIETKIAVISQVVHKVASQAPIDIPQQKTRRRSSTTTHHNASAMSMGSRSAADAAQQVTPFHYSPFVKPTPPVVTDIQGEKDKLLSAEALRIQARELAFQQSLQSEDSVMTVSSGKSSDRPFGRSAMSKRGVRSRRR